MAISYDAVEILKQFGEKEGIEYTLLSDPNSATMKAYGVFHESGRGIPHPTLFLLDHNRTVIGKLRCEGYKQRHQSSDILAAVKALGTQAD